MAGIYSEDSSVITLRTALAKSRNAATIRILSDIGLAPVRDMTRALGIASKMEMNLGLALGNSEVTLAELVRAYTPFAALGRRIDPIFILEVRDRSGRVIAKDVSLLASQSATETPPVGQGSERARESGRRRRRAVMEKLRGG
jgi:membrane carboxypeptidase/penicillin-binding protein